MLQTLADIPHSKARRNELHHRLKHLDRADRLQLLSMTLDDPYPPIRHDVAEAFQRELDWSGGHSGPSGDEIAGFLESIAVGEKPDHELTRAIGLPRQFLPDESMRSRMVACVALEASPTPQRTVERLRPLLAGDNADLRYQTLIAVERLAGDSPETHKAVVEALDDHDPEIVVVATQIAVKYGWADLLPRFIDARARLGGEDRIQATFSVGALIDNSSLTPGALPPEARSDMIAECVDALSHEPHTAAAIKTLARLEATEAADALVEVLGGWFTHPILKVEAAAALVELDHPRGEQHLEKALGSRRKDARGYALRIVGHYRIDRFFSHLVDVATTETYHADTATLALADYGGDETDELLAQIAESHPDDEVRHLAQDALQDPDDRRALEHLPTDFSVDPTTFDATIDR